MKLWRAELPHFCCGFLVQGGVIVEAAPIMYWAVKQRLSPQQFQAWALQRKGRAFQLDPEDPMLPKRRLLLAHPKTWTDQEVQEACARLKALVEQYTGQPASVVSGIEDYKHQESSSYEGWAQDVATANLFGSTEQRITTLVVPTLRIGKGVLALVQSCMVAKKSMVYWRGNEFYPFTSFRQVDGNDFQTGWELHE